MRILLLCLLVWMPCWHAAMSADIPKAEKSEWMKFLPDTLPVCKISIPGSHDSGSIYGGRSLETQTSTIPEQLRAGIRAFDIRLGEKEGKLGLFHSYAFQGIYWEEDVLPALIGFLKRHPSEMLVVSLKKEGGELKDYVSLLAASLGDPRNQRYFVTDFRPGLTLEECRGKILFLHRDDAMEAFPGAACSGWKDNATCVLTLRSKDGTEGYALLQDEYQYRSVREADKKITASIRNLDNAAREPDDSRRWGISFVSATGLPWGTPRVFADKVNPAVADHIRKFGNRSYGIVFIDFVEEKEGRELSDCLIDCNLNGPDRLPNYENREQGIRCESRIFTINFARSVKKVKFAGRYTRTWRNW